MIPVTWQLVYHKLSKTKGFNSVLSECCYKSLINQNDQNVPSGRLGFGFQFKFSLIYGTSDISHFHHPWWMPNTLLFVITMHQPGRLWYILFKQNCTKHRNVKPRESFNIGKLWQVGTLYLRLSKYFRITRCSEWHSLRTEKCCWPKGLERKSLSFQTFKKFL